MTVEDDLLAQIRENPGDDAIRLVYADALIARGDEQGEYIALEIARERDHTQLTPAQWARHAELGPRQRERERELEAIGISNQWRRGFPSFMQGTVSKLLDLSPIRRLPIQHLGVLADSEMARLVAQPELEWIEHLSLRSKLVETPIARDQIEALCRATTLRRLTKLQFSEGSLSDANAELLAAAPWLAQLEQLSISSLGGAGLEFLLAGPMPRLRSLELTLGELANRGAAAFATASLPVLERVRLYQTRLGRAGTQRWVSAPCLATVRELAIRNDDGRGLRFGELPALRTLEIDNLWLDDDDAIALATGPTLPELDKLVLAHSSIGDAGAAALAASQRFPKLAHLDLSHNQLTRDGALAFVHRTGLPSLTTLGLSNNPMPTGRIERVSYYDQGAEVSAEDQQVPYGLAQIRSWFAGTGVEIV